jgi:hypothetical protein
MTTLEQVILGLAIAFVITQIAGWLWLIWSALVP